MNKTRCQSVRTDNVIPHSATMRDTVTPELKENEMKTLFAVLGALVLSTPLAAAPADYVLQPATSTVGFETNFGKDHITGKMPITAADLTLDFDNIANCKVAVTLDASGAQASFPFAAQAMKGPKVLDTDAHPQIIFASTKVIAVGSGAKVEGVVTIRGTSKPMVLDAQIFRQKGTATGDLSHLSIRLTGAVQRSQFGANGWADMVGDEVRLDILARIARVK
ncbi:MAG: YceI family protein [Rhodoferax sp.]|nr:YceI family protein [Pseudorhodobacter sp.]